MLFGKSLLPYPHYPSEELEKNAFIPRTMEGEVLVLGCVVVVFLLAFRVVHAATAAVEHAKGWCEYNFFVKLSHTKTEIHVFIVEKESLVESVKAKKECAGNGECGAAYPGN